MATHGSWSCCCCHESYDDGDEYVPCYGCEKYQKIDKNICRSCEDSGTALVASRYGDNLDANEYSENYIFCSQSCRAQFNFRFIMYPKAFSVGKLSLSLKLQKQRNYERNYWVNTLMPVVFAAARDPNQHPVWNYLYQERKALLIPLLPTLAMTHLGHDLPYQRSTIITKLKEPTVLLTKKSCSALRWPAGKKPEMNLREYLHKFDIVPWL